MVSAEGVPAPEGLYRAEDLLGGWSAADPESYAGTLDARTYSAAVAAGLRTARDEDVAQARALHDHHVTRGLHAEIAGEKVVAFMGGHKLARGSEAYRLVAELAWTLAGDGYLVTTGGGPGAMEAAHLGARLSRSSAGELHEAIALISADEATRGFPDVAGAPLTDPSGRFDPAVLRAIHAWQGPAFAVAERWSGERAGRSIGIPTWLYGHEPPTPLATHLAKYYENSIREDGLLAIAIWGVIFAEGKAGTLQEVFQDAAQNYYATVDGTRSRMVFLDVDKYWTVTRPVRLLLEGLFDDPWDDLLHFVTTVDEAAAAIALGPIT